MKALLKQSLRKAFELYLDDIVELLLAKCLECGENRDHFHHLVPKVYNGKTVVPVCHECHGHIHNKDFTDHKELTIQGMIKAGRKIIDQETLRKIAEELSQGKTYLEIRKKFEVGNSTILKARSLFPELFNRN